MMIRAVYDACVLYSASLRDFLLRLASAGLVFPFWSERIQNEWIYSLLRKRPDLTLANQERTRREMNSHFPNSLVRGHEPIIPTLALADPDDRHVLATAIHAEAKYIVTFNLKHFPKTLLQPYKIEAVSPDKFVFQLIQQVPNPVILVAKTHRLSLSRPPKTVDEYLATLEKQGLPKTIAFLREHKDDL
jgi:predicted nucleic acid-binding protein